MILKGEQIIVAAEPDEIAARRQALGDRLAAFRQAAGLTQGQLAKAAFCDRTTVVHIEKGRRSADDRFWRVADETCDAGGALVAEFTALEAAKHSHEQRRHAEAVAAARARAVTSTRPAPAQWAAPLPDDGFVGHIGPPRL